MSCQDAAVCQAGPQCPLQTVWQGLARLVCHKGNRQAGVRLCHCQGQGQTFRLSCRLPCRWQLPIGPLGFNRFLPGRQLPKYRGSNSGSRLPGCCRFTGCPLGQLCNLVWFHCHWISLLSGNAALSFARATLPFQPGRIARQGRSLSRFPVFASLPGWPGCPAARQPARQAARLPWPGCRRSEVRRPLRLPWPALARSGCPALARPGPAADRSGCPGPAAGGQRSADRSGCPGPAALARLPEVRGPPTAPAALARPGPLRLPCPGPPWPGCRPLRLPWPGQRSADRSGCPAALVC